MAFQLPSIDKVGKLPIDSELSKEWSSDNSAILSDGTEINYSPPPTKPVMPDWSEIKPIRKYFNRTYKNNHWPTWLYNHETGDAMIVKDSKEAKEHGVTLRQRTEEEKQKFGGDGVVWDWEPGCHWRITPKPKPRTYDPRKPEYGKEFIQHAVPNAVAQSQMLQEALPIITAAVVEAMTKGSNAAVRPLDTGGAEINPERWKKFIAFEAWERTQAAAEDVIEPALTGEPPLEPVVEGEYQLWLDEASKHNIKVDKRWSLKTLKDRVQQAA